MKWSIRGKFLVVMCGLLGLGLGVYLFMAVTVFKSDKTQLVFDLNRSQVSNLTSELETQFNGVSEKLKVFALLPVGLQNKVAGDLLSEGSSVVGIAIYRTVREDAKPDRLYTQERFVETYGLESATFKETLQSMPIPLAEIMKNGEDLWNASLEKGPPLIGYGRLVVLQDQNGVPVEQWVVVGYVKLDRFLKSVSIVRLSEVVVANRRGEVLVHPDAKQVLLRSRIKDDPLFREALTSKSKVSVVHREGDGGGVLAAVAKGFNEQIIVLARASENQVFRVVRELSVRTMLFGSLVLTLVILASFFISRSLTENISLLTERMESVAKGDLSTRIKLHGRDETVLLANTFNQMIHDLKESRDALETMNRELDQKVKERTEQLEEQHRKVKEIQEALVQTTRLASVGELAGRTAHEVLNPLTILLTRVGLMQKRVQPVLGGPTSPLSLLEEIRSAWNKDYAAGGFERLLGSWKTPSSVMQGKTLFEEDLENLTRCSAEILEHEKNIAKDIQFVKEEGERIGKIINNMRRLGHSKSDFQKYSVHALLNDCCAIMSDLFEQKGFKIEQHFEAADYHCMVDRDEMVQSITNLMRNSLQALEVAHGENPRIVLRTTTVEGYICIDIEDNGAGVLAEHQSKLFDSTFTTKSHDEGTGLGLGIARRFIRGHGGEIEFVSSAARERTVFRVRLPLAEEARTGAVA